jgi:hypothetical protein
LKEGIEKEKGMQPIIYHAIYSWRYINNVDFYFVVEADRGLGLSFFNMKLETCENKRARTEDTLQSCRIQDHKKKRTELTPSAETETEPWEKTPSFYNIILNRYNEFKI